jgi:NADPH-dependent curcumin reductase CurA
VRGQLAAAAPEGIDVYFDNVGGDHLEAALDVFNDGGRAALCGAIASYNSSQPTPGPDNMANMITRGLTLRGFTLGAYLAWLRSSPRR